jgi:hypothetical protein
MPCYIPESVSATPARPASSSASSALLVAIIEDVAFCSRELAHALRIAAAYRSRLLETQPDLWRSFEIHYRQHVRPYLCAGEARHWDAALRLPE